MTTDMSATAVPIDVLSRNKATAAAFHGPFNTGDVDGLDAYLAPAWTNHPRNPHEGDGPAGFKGTIAFIRSVFPDIRFNVEDVIGEGDKVMVRSLAVGTHTGTTLGPPTGKIVSFRTLDYHQFDDAGLIVRSWHLEDAYAMLATIGLIANVYEAQIEPYPGWD